MSAGLAPYTFIGNGTETSGSRAIFDVTPHANTLQGDLIVAVAYAYGLPAIVNSGADGWIIPLKSASLNGSTSYSFFMAITVASRHGSSGYSPMLSTGGACWWHLQCSTFRATPPARWDIASLGVSECIYESVYSLTMKYPGINLPGQQCIDLYGCSASMTGKTTDFNAPTGFTERFNSYSAVLPSGNIGLGDRLVNGSTFCDVISNSNSQTSLYRFASRVAIPIVGNTLFPGRLQGGRRLLG